jgi:hypothetical protein
VGAVLIGSLTTTFIQGVTNNPAVPPEVSAKASVEMSSGVPFISDADLRTALEKTDLSPSSQDAIVAENASARLAGLRSSLGLVALLAVVGLFFTGMLPRRSLRAEGDRGDPRPP